MGASFHLNHWLNMPDEKSGLNILDYCILAGLDTLAMRIGILGGHTENIGNLSNFIAQFNKNDNLDKIMQATINNVHEAQNFSHEQNFQQPTSKGHRVREFIKNNKIPILLVTAGVVCTAAAPFSGGLTEVLYAVGVSATISSMGAFQASKALQTSFGHVEDQSRVFYELREIKNLMKVTRGARDRIDDEILKLTGHKDKVTNTTFNNIINAMNPKKEMAATSVMAPHPTKAKADKSSKKLAQS